MDTGEITPRPVPFLATALAVFVLVANIIILWSWKLSLPALLFLSFGLVTAKFNTALTFVFLALALLLLQDKNAGRLRKVAGRVCASLGLLSGILHFCEYVLKTNLGIDEFFVKETLFSAAAPYPGRMGFGASVAFILLSLALLWLEKRFRKIILAEVACCIVLAFGLVSIVGYIYGTFALKTLGSFNATALSTAINLIILSIAIIVARNDRGIVQLIMGPTSGGIIARRLLPLAVLLPALLGWIALKSSESGCFDLSFGAALADIFMTLLLSAAIVWNARSVNSVEQARDEAGKNLQKVADELRDLYENSPCGYLSVDGSGLVVAANATILNWLGYAKDQVVGNVSFFDLASKVSRDDCLVHLSRLWQEDFAHELELQMLRKDSSVFPALLTARTFQNESGNLKTVRISVFDTSESKRREEAERGRDVALEASRLKSQFVAHVSHELRTPLGAVVGLSELALSALLPEDVRPLIEAVDQAGKSLLGVVNDILDISQIEAGKVRIAYQPFIPGAVVSECVRLLRLSAEQKKLELGLFLADDLPVCVYGDPMRLRQLLLNLIGNAIKFTPCGSVSVEAHVERQEPDRATIRFSVSDTGVGISKQDQELLFSPFSQVGNSGDRQFPGTGLGLHINMLLAEMMNGKIGCQSEIGRGSTFWFTLPLDLAPAGTNAGSPGAVVPELLEAEPGSTSVLQKVLVVADDPVCQLLTLRQLAMLEVEGKAVSRGAEAISEFSSGDYDAVLLDLRLPDMSGIEVVSIIRSMEETAEVSTGKRIPLICVTASALKDESDQAFSAGVDRCLTKPVSLEQLQGVLNSCLSNRTKIGL